MKRVRKHYELSEQANNKLMQLIEFRNNENDNIGLPRVSEKSMIEESIDLLHSSKFGKDVFDNTMTKLENVLGTLMINTLNEYAKPFSNVLENIYIQNDMNKEMILFILKANGILPENQFEIDKLIDDNEELNKLIKSSVLQKKEKAE
ncbi:MAG: hypothetical protein RSD85_00055 [Erysipelotrichaceae bacterium]